MENKLSLELMIMIRLDKNTYSRLNKLAKEYGESKSSIVRIAINRFYNDFVNQKF